MDRPKYRDEGTTNQAFFCCGRNTELSAETVFRSYTNIVRTYFLFRLRISIISGLGSEVVLLCSSCNETFLHPWDLLVHVQRTHSLHIYEEMEDNIKELPLIEQQ